MTDESTRFLTSTEVALRLGVRLDYVYRMLWSGTIPGTRMDGKWAIPESSVEARLARIAARHKKTSLTSQ